MNAVSSLTSSLQSILERPDVWRGASLARLSGEGLQTGFARLDAELPGAGWPRGALTELLSDQVGIGELALLQPALVRCLEQAPLAVLAPPMKPHAPAWAAMLPLASVLWVAASGQDAAWAAEQLIASGALGAVLIWLPDNADARVLRRLQLAAEGHPAPVFVFRGERHARSPSPSPLRLALTGTPAGLRLTLLKRRGPPCAQPLILTIPRPVAAERLSRRLQVRPAQHAGYEVVL